MYCGICVEVCPFDALFWSPAFEHAATTRGGLVHDRDLLRRSLDTVPLPPAHDPHGEPSKEEISAERD
jgi:NADH-quinone oxidoreductase subunit I